MTFSYISWNNIRSISACCEGICSLDYLWWSFWNWFIAQSLEGLCGSVVSCCLASSTLSDELMTPHRQLHIKDLRNRIMVPEMNKTTRHLLQHLHQNEELMDNGKLICLQPEVTI